MQARATAVTVDERMHPTQTLMRTGHADQRQFQTLQSLIALAPFGEQPGTSSGGGARCWPTARASLRQDQPAVIGDALVLRHAAVQRSVNLANPIQRVGGRRIGAGFQRPLRLHVGNRQPLLHRLAAIAVPLLLKRAVNIGRPRVLRLDLVRVPLDKVDPSRIGRRINRR